MGASFVQAGSDGPASFGEICRRLREKNATWLAASPTNLAIEHTVRLSDATPWISIQNVVDDELLAQLSKDLGTTAITIYALDEIRLTFSYRRFEEGGIVRALEYGDGKRPRDRGAWTKVDGEREEWEGLLFSDSLTALYRKYALDEVDEVCPAERIKLGHSIPWACDGETVAQIVERLSLPWRPLDDTFAPASRTEVIPGSPERWQELHRSFRKPWWKLW
jgi:hypothetical protein